MNAAAPVVIAQRNKIIQHFKKAGATAPDRTIDPATRQIRQSLVFNRLVREGILVKVAAHHYYLDESRVTAYRTPRQQALLVAVAVVLIAVALALFLMWL